MNEGLRGFRGGDTPYPVEELREQFRWQAEHPPGGDPTISNMFAIFGEQQPDSIIYKTNESLAKDRYGNFPRTKPDEFANILRASYCMYFLRNNQKEDEPHFDYSQVSTKEDMLKHLEQAARAITEDSLEDMVVSQIHYFVRHAYLQTTLISRYAPFGVLLRITEDRLPPEGADWLDDGASIGQGAYQIFYSEEEPLQFDVVSQFDDENPYEVSDEALKIETNSLLLGKLPVARCVCLDIENVYLKSRKILNPASTAWAEASLQPQEHMNTRFMHRFVALQHKVTDKIEHLPLDISNDEDYATFRDIIGSRRFDAITGITTYYPHTRELVLKKLRRYKELLKPGGFFYLQDSIQIGNKRSRQPLRKLQMRQDFHGAGSYTGILSDRTLRHPGIQQLFAFRGTRAKEVSVNPDAVIKMDGRVMPLTDAIQLRASVLNVS